MVRQNIEAWTEELRGSPVTLRAAVFNICRGPAELQDVPGTSAKIPVTGTFIKAVKINPRSCLSTVQWAIFVKKEWYVSSNACTRPRIHHIRNTSFSKGP